MTKFSNSIYLISILIAIFLYPYRSFSQNIAHDFSQTDNFGNIHNLYTELSLGNTVLLDFFSVYCGTCQASASNIEQIWLDYGSGNNNLLVWGIECSGVNDSLISLFEDNYGTTFPLLSTKNNNQVIFDYNVTFTPTYVVICPDKKMKTITYDNIRGLINACGNTTSVTNFKTNNEFIYISGNSLIINQKNEFYLKIIDISGRMVYSNHFKNEENKVIFSIRNFQKGIYFVNIFNKKETISKKVIL